MQRNYNTYNLCRTKLDYIRELEYLSPQANSSFGEVLSLSLKVSLLLLKEPPFLFETLLLLQCVAVIEKSCCLIVK